jgi:hypothetical protein
MPIGFNKGNNNNNNGSSGEDTSSHGMINALGTTGVIASLAIAGVGLFIAMKKHEDSSSSESMSVNPLLAHSLQSLERPPKSDATPSPDASTQAPASNAPARGPMKDTIYPERCQSLMSNAKVEGSKMFSFPSTAVMRWDVLPFGAKTVGVGFALSNPPMALASLRNQPMMIMSTATPGFAIELQGDWYRLVLGNNTTLTIPRDNSNFDTKNERVCVMITFKDAGTAGVSVFYNGRQQMISDKISLSIGDIKNLDQNLALPSKDKMNNVWMGWN